MGCKARIKSLHTGETHYGECVDLSVDGMAFRCSFVPQHGERLSVIVLAPLWVACRASRWRPRWKCGAATRSKRGQVYEIGTRIIQRKAETAA
jgi:hypothetical protein